MRMYVREESDALGNLVLPQVQVDKCRSLARRSLGRRGPSAFLDHLVPYTLLGGAPRPPDPPGLKIYETLNFSFFFLWGPWGNFNSPLGPLGPHLNKGGVRSTPAGS